MTSNRLWCSACSTCTALAKDEWWHSFKVFENTITALYEACKPEVLGDPVVRQVALFQYLRGVIDSIIQQQDIDSATRRINGLLDESVVVDDDDFKQVKNQSSGWKIEQRGRGWDLSKIDLASSGKTSNRQSTRISRSPTCALSWKGSYSRC